MLTTNLSNVNQKLSLLNEKIKNASDEDELFAIMDFKRKRTEEKDELIRKINAIENESEVIRLDYEYDVDAITNQDNTALRRKVNGHIAKVISSIRCLRKDSSFIGSFYLYDINYHKDMIKHLLITDNDGYILSEVTIIQKGSEKNYRVQESGKTVFEVKSNGDAWVLYADRKKTVDELLHYMNTMMVGRESEDFVYQLNEDQIEWID